jgi:hypothetical protein
MSCRACWNCPCTCADGWWTSSIEIHHYSFPIWRGVSMSRLTPQINYPIYASTCFSKHCIKAQTVINQFLLSFYLTPKPAHVVIIEKQKNNIN